jgi:hypothetical protein
MEATTDHARSATRSSVNHEGANNDHDARRPRPPESAAERGNTFMGPQPNRRVGVIIVITTTTLR